MPNTTVTITYANGSTREFVASDELEQSINEGEMFSVTTMHSDISIKEEMSVSKMYIGNPMAALGNMMIMQRNAQNVIANGKRKERKQVGIVLDTLNACITFMSDEITSHQSGMSPVLEDYQQECVDTVKNSESVHVEMDDAYIKEDCPVINNFCAHYTYQTDNSGEVAIEHCTHPSNPEDTEGNCTEKLCPIKQGIVTPVKDCTGDCDGCS